MYLDCKIPLLKIPLQLHVHRIDLRTKSTLRIDRCQHMQLLFDRPDYLQSLLVAQTFVDEEEVLCLCHLRRFLGEGFAFVDVFGVFEVLVLSLVELFVSVAEVDTEFANLL